METVCNVDIEFSDKIAALLKPPSPQEVQEYSEELIARRQCGGLTIKQDGESGKGVYANLEFREGELVLKDQMLVGAQHSSSKVDCLVCSFCFRFIGSIELQIGRKLYLQDLGFSPSSERDTCSHSYTSKDYYRTNPTNEDDSFMADCDNSGACSSSETKERIPLPRETVESLKNGELVLPYSKQFSLPSAISCPGGCEEAYYCSKLCANADWELFHSLLCMGKRSGSVSKQSLVKFIEHANETNDIFLLAAKAISFTILKYKKLKVAHLEEQKQYTEINGFNDTDVSLLFEAWKPMSMGYKRRWWDCIALPDDVDSDDEATFRMQIRELAFTSLQFLKEAIFDGECAPWFTTNILESAKYSRLKSMGMFELNNLDLVVASPVEDYFLYIDGLPYPEKEEAEKITQSILDALGEDYSICCQGTAFFPLQSCMNHSCCPNAKAFKREEDRDGQATIIALRPISKGEELTISYIDENLSFEERRALLADYSFRCRCPKCLEEET